MNTKSTILGAAILGLVVFSGSASAQDTATGTLAVTGTVVSSISLTIESAGGDSQSGMTTDTATTDLGTISKFGGVVPTGFTRAQGATDWTLTSTIGVTVTKANSASSFYTLNAKLSTAPDAGIDWSVNGVLLNAALAEELTATGGWGSTPTYAWTIVIDDSIPSASAIDNVIEFDAIST